MFLQTVEDVELLIKPEASELLARLNWFLAARDIQAYLVGGFVRDTLLGRDTGDVDIAVAADGLKTAAELADAIGGKYVLLDEVNGIGRVVLPDGKWELDFSTLRGDIQNDLSQRDFTVDAMGIALGKVAGRATVKESDIIDPFGGKEDIKRKTVRAVNETVFQADPARLLRAVRLVGELGFSVDGGMGTLIERNANLISGVAGERVREELVRILALPGGQPMEYMDRLGLLTAIIPELANARGVTQPIVHFWDVFTHSLKIISAVDFLLRRGNWEYGSEAVLSVVPWSDVLKEHFEGEVNSGTTRRSILKLAALLHDIAKPQTKEVNEEGRAHFLGHPGEGAAIATAILERLRFSAKEVRLVEIMVENHMRPGQMSNNQLPTHRAIYRYFRDTGNAGIDILFLSMADHLATRGPNLDLAQWQEHATITQYVLAEYFAEKSLAAPPKLIDGHDLINIFGLDPGPQLGTLLEAVREAQAAGEVNTREEALAFIKSRITNRNSNRPPWEKHD